MIATAPLPPWVTDWTTSGPPSMSVSLARTSMGLAPESSVTVAVSATALGASSTALIVMEMVRVTLVSTAVQTLATGAPQLSGSPRSATA